MNKNQKLPPVLVANLALLFLTLALLLTSPFSKPNVTSFAIKHPGENAVQNTGGTTGGIDVSNQQLLLTFSRPMNEQQVTQHVHFEPDIEGNFSWANSTLFFTPTQILQYAQNYTVTIDDQAEDSYHTQLGHQTVFHFVTKPYQFIYVGDHDQLFLGDLNGKKEALTDQKTLREFVVNSHAHFVAYTSEPKQDETSELYITDFVSKTTQRIAPELNKHITNLQITRDGKYLYFLAIPTTAEENSSIQNDSTQSAQTTNNAGTQLDTLDPTAKIYRYDVQTQKLEESSLLKDYPNLSRFWIASDGNTFLVNDLSGELYLRAIEGGQSIALGKFAEYRGGTTKGDPLLFVDSSPDLDYVQGVVLYNGQAHRLTDEKEIAATPSISGDGKFISYSYVPKNVVTGEGEEGFRLVSLPENKTIFERFDPSLSFELSKISPDNHYVAVEVYTKDQLKDFTAIRHVGEPDKPEDALIEFFDTHKNQALPFTVQGKELQWIE